ncbi:MAG: NERD domain-containing protein [Actinomycetota bacterium]|nr:NERD domain-containing protein [Actinomycetota bacterium]
MAGESARTKAERLRRNADRYERGAQWEEATAEVLADLPAGWTVLHDVAWPDRKLANLDHVVVGPPGVFVIDSKNWSGRVAADRGLLRHDRRSRVPTVQGALAGVASVAKVVPEVRREHVYAVLCFSGSDAPDALSDGVLVCSTGSLLTVLTSRPAALPDELVQALADVLPSRLPSASAPRPARVGKPRQRSRSRSRKRGEPDRLVKLIAAVAFGLALAANPGVFTAISDGVSGLLGDQVTTPEDEQVEPQEKKKDDVPVKKVQRER